MRLYDDFPRIVIWEATRACALACDHCRAAALPHRDPNELTTDEALRLIDEVAEWGHPLFIVTGGDPLMRPDIYDVVEHAAKRGLRVAVSPSATGRLTRESLRRLSYAGCKHLSLSLDGPDADTHDAFRGVRGVFDRTLAIARDAVEVGFSLQINTTIGRHNHRHVAEMAAVIASAGARAWSLFFLIPTGRAKRAQSLSARQQETLFAELYEIWLRAPFDVKTTEAPHFRRYVLERLAVLLPEERPPKATTFSRVPAIGDGRGLVFVSHVGDVQPSGFLPLSAGNVRRQTLIEIYRTDPILRRLRDPDTFGGNCGRCEYHLVCGGSRARAFAFTGDPFAADPGCVLAC